MQASDWIKCSDRMPEIGQRVLIFHSRFHSYKFSMLFVDYDNRKRWGKDVGFSSSYELDEITHWMPIVGPEEE